MNLRSFLVTISLPFYAHLSYSAGLYPTFKAWDAACSNLPSYRVIGSSYEFKAAGFTWKEMEQTLYECANVFKMQLLRNPAAWFGQKPSAHFFDLKKTFFWPYAQKVIVPVGSTIAFHGDIHGDVKSLLVYIKELQKKGYLDAADAFKIKDPTFYMVFLGDYTDRGIYGAEVIYTLLRLKIANPDQVFLVRGNHEDHSINAYYGFEAEMNAKFGSKNQKLVYNFYNLLPVVLYIGSGDQQINYVQCCHGGMEIGYLPNDLLNKPGAIAYQHIAILKQKTNIQTIVPTIADRNMIFQRYPVSDFVPTSPQQIGFLWNDFYVPEFKEYENEPWVINAFHYQPGRGWIYGRDITQVLLKYSSTQHNRVVGVMRAHQHDNEPHGMSGLILDKHYPDTLGVAKLWRSHRQNGSLWPGIVCTFNLSPDTPHGESRMPFDFDTYGLVTTGALYPQDWTFTVHRIMQTFAGIAGRLQ